MFIFYAKYWHWFHNGPSMHNFIPVLKSEFQFGPNMF